MILKFCTEYVSDITAIYAKFGAWVPENCIREEHNLTNFIIEMSFSRVSCSATAGRICFKNNNNVEIYNQRS